MRRCTCGPSREAREAIRFYQVKRPAGVTGFVVAWRRGRSFWRRRLLELRRTRLCCAVAVAS